MGGVNSVSSSCVVDVVARLLEHRAVVGKVVDPLERQRGTEFKFAFSGMVVDHVENNLDAGVMSADHVPEANNALQAVVTGSWREKPGELYPQ